MPLARNESQGWDVTGVTLSQGWKQAFLILRCRSAGGLVRGRLLRCMISQLKCLDELRDLAPGQDSRSGGVCSS